MEKIIIFDWGGVIMHRNPVPDNHKEATIRVLKYFNDNLSDEEAWDSYLKSLVDEAGIYISIQDDEISKEKWFNRINELGKLNTTFDLFIKKFIEEYLTIGYYKDVVNYIYSLKGKCKLGLFSDLIFCCKPALDNQIDLSVFDYVWLSYLTHYRKSMIDAFIYVEHDLDINPDNILFIDDTSVNINNALKRGWQTCQAEGHELDKIKNAVDKFLNN